MEVKMNKEIRDYQESMFMGLDLRQCVCSVLAILTAVGQSFGSLITGTIVTETLFNIPGLGMLTMGSINRRDVYVIQGVVLFVTLLYVLVNLVVDILYGFVDPRLQPGRNK